VVVPPLKQDSMLDCGHCLCKECANTLTDNERANVHTCEICAHCPENDAVELAVQHGLPVSSKIKHLLTILSQRQENSAVCCQFVLSCRLVKCLAKPENSSMVGNRTIFEITGKTKPHERLQILEQLLFKPHILIFSLKTGGTGWNLLNTVNMFLLEPHWNPQLEHQAAERIWRLHHWHSKVRVFNLVLLDSIDMRINLVKKAKENACEGALQGQYAGIPIPRHSYFYFHLMKIDFDEESRQYECKVCLEDNTQSESRREQRTQVLLTEFSRSFRN